MISLLSVPRAIIFRTFFGACPTSTHILIDVFYLGIFFLRRVLSSRAACRQDNLEFHHAHAPSNATMLVYDSDVDNVTDDYLLSQQLQDRGGSNSPK